MYQFQVMLCISVILILFKVFAVVVKLFTLNFFSYFYWTSSITVAVANNQWASCLHHVYCYQL